MQRYAVPAFTDILASHVAQTLQGESRQAVLVTRRPRQTGRDAAAYVSNAPADGHTLLLASGVAATGQSLRPVALVASMPYVFITTNDSRHTSLAEVIRQTRPTRLLIGTAGEKSAAHLSLELLRARSALPIEPVAYNGGNAALQAVATKQVMTALVPLPAVLPYLGGNRLTVLAIADMRRHASIPQVKTSAEAGLADFQASGWFGIFAPAATPQSAIQNISSLSGSPQPEATQVFADFGLRLEYRTTAEFAELLAREQQRGSSSSASRLRKS
jgi:tripartite-type tricarboxylate transporter receptor subunit TctC